MTPVEQLTKIGSYELSRSRLQTNDGRYELRLSGVANPSDKPGTHLYDHKRGISTHSQQWGDEIRQLEWMDGYNEGCYMGSVVDA
jgi:hypothetical protein